MRSKRAIASTLTLGLMTLAACGGGTNGSNADGDGAAADAGAGATAKSGEGPPVDLAGVSFTITTSKPDALSTPAYYAIDLLREWGADVEHVELVSTTGIQTMVAGKSDIAAHGADEVILGRAQDVPTVAFGSHRTKQAYVLIARDEIKSVEELKGNSIAMSGPSGFDALLSRYALRQVGLSANDVNFVQIGGSPDRAAALLSGAVGAGTIFISNWLSLKRRTDDVHLLINFGKTTKFPGSAYFSTRSYLNKHPKLALGLACANLEANAWVNNNKEEYIQLTLELVEGVGRDSVEAVWEVGQKVRMWPVDPEDIITTQGYRDLAEIMGRGGAIDTASIPVRKMVDKGYLEEAADMGCGAAGN